MTKLPQKMLPIRYAAVDYGLNHRGQIERFEIQTATGMVSATALEGLEIAILILAAYTENNLTIGGNNVLRLENILEKL